jgi:hypothetical protein
MFTKPTGIFINPITCTSVLHGSVSFRGKLRSGQTPDYQKLYHAAEIRSRSTAAR